MPYFTFKNSLKIPTYRYIEEDYDHIIYLNTEQVDPFQPHTFYIGRHSPPPSLFQLILIKYLKLCL